MRLTSFLLAGIVLAGTTLALAQEHHPPTDSPQHWYDRECCSERDCRPALPGEVVADTKRGGWLAHDQFIAWESHADRESKDPQDTRMHICINQYTDKVLCIYKPAAGG